MKIKKSLPITPINYFSEGQLLYVLLPDKSGVQFATFDAKTFETLSTFIIKDKLTHNQMIIHDECLFLITVDGIIGYDTFTGQQTVFMQTGSLVPLSMGILEDKLVSLCGIPLNRNNQVETDNFCISVNDVSTGVKFAQSYTFHESSQLTLADGIWFVADGFLHKLSTECEVIGKIRLVSRPDIPLISTDDYIISVSDMGTLEIFYKDIMKRHINILVDRNNSPPLVCDNTLLWFTGTTLKRIDLSDGTVSQICEVQNEVVSSLEKVNDSIYAADAQGNLLNVSMGTHTSISIVKLAKEQAWKPIHSGESIFIASKEALHQIEVKS